MDYIYVRLYWFFWIKNKLGFEFGDEDDDLKKTNIGIWVWWWRRCLKLVELIGVKPCWSKKVSLLTLLTYTYPSPVF